MITPANTYDFDCLYNLILIEHRKVAEGFLNLLDVTLNANYSDILESATIRTDDTDPDYYILTCRCCRASLYYYKPVSRNYNPVVYHNSNCVIRRFKYDLELLIFHNSLLTSDIILDHSSWINSYHNVSVKKLVECICMDQHDYVVQDELVRGDNYDVNKCN